MKKLILILALIINLSAFSQDDKTVTLVVSGQGKTQDEAKQNALRSAIEQAFGTFISSKTEILNDNLVKDEIVSISNGNIQKFDIISEVQIPDGGYAATLKATVSVTKLTSFVESKGVGVEFKGGLFAENIKLQNLYEKNELKTVDNILNVFTSLLNQAFEIKLKSNNPIFISKDYYEIKHEVSFLDDKMKYSNAIEFLKENLNAISLTSEESVSYLSIGKPIFNLMFSNKSESLRENNYEAEVDYKCILRNKESLIHIYKSILLFQKKFYNFKIVSSIDTFTHYISGSNIHKFLKDNHAKNNSVNRSEINGRKNNYFNINNSDEINTIPILINSSSNHYYSSDIFGEDYSNVESLLLNDYIRENIKEGLIVENPDVKNIKSIIKHNINSYYTLSDLEKINEFSIEFIDSIKNKEQEPIFKSIKYGEMFWSEKNLNVKYFNNGDRILNSQQIKLNNTGLSWHYYDNNEENGKKYGAMYGYQIIKDKRKICPNGWHVPSSIEWENLFSIIGPSKHQVESLVNNGFGEVLGGNGCYPCWGDPGTVGYFWTSDDKLLILEEIGYGHIRVKTKDLSTFNEMETSAYIRCIKD
jgi:uncharacterized protein (TIGR02145 family)